MYVSVLALIVVLFTFTFKVVPHITNAIQDWIERVSMIPVDGKEGPADVCVIELGGTIGSII
jgi:CTP synthase